MSSTDKVGDFIKTLVKKLPDAETGKKEIINFLKKNYPQYTLQTISGIDFNRTLVEFENWLVSTVTSDPVPTSMKSIYFNIQNPDSEDIQNQIGEIQLCLTGSKFASKEKADSWMKNKIYEPQNKLSEIKAYKTLSNSLKNNQDELTILQDAIFSPLTTLLMINGFDIIRHEFLIYQQEIDLGFGFSNGRTTVIGKLNEDGFVGTLV